MNLLRLCGYGKSLPKTVKDKTKPFDEQAFFALLLMERTAEVKLIFFKNIVLFFD